ncbi:MAG: HAD family hydrolase, partial [Nitrospirae bacterium]
VVDKTGTLTTGVPAVQTVSALPGGSDEEVLRLAASVEKVSEHPLAAAVVSAAQAKGLVLSPVQAFRSQTGEGVSGEVEGKIVALGNRIFLERDAGIAASELAGVNKQADTLRAQGQTVIFLAVDGHPAGLIGVSDPIRPTTPEALAALKREGLRIVMVTGDHRHTAEAVAKQLPIDEIHAEVLPEHKHQIVKRLRQQGHIVAMAGDGINDAPALAEADVGIAMGTGTDVAMASAGITLVKGDLRGVVRARRLSRATMRNIRQNLFFAFVYNSLGVPLASGVLYPIFGILLTPIIASVAMTFSSVSVILNALRLRHLPI